MPDSRDTPLTSADWDRITGAARRLQDDALEFEALLGHGDSKPPFRINDPEGRAEMAHRGSLRGDRLLRALAPLFWAALGAGVVVLVLTAVEVVG